MQAEDAGTGYQVVQRSPEENRRLRAECPVAHTGEGTWYVSSAEAVQAVLKDVDSFRADLAPMSGLQHLDQVPPEQYFLSEISPPRHGRVRRLFNAWFGPHRVSATEPFVRSLCHRLVDDMLAAEVADLHGDYAMQIPSHVMARAMDLDEAAAADFMRWSYDGSILLRPCTPGLGPDEPEIQAFFARELAAAARRPDGPRRPLPLLLGGRHRGRPPHRPGDRDAAPLHDPGRGPHHPGAPGPPGRDAAVRPRAVRPPAATTAAWCPVSWRNPCATTRRPRC